METIAVIAVYTNGAWRFERLMKDEAGEFYTVGISKGEYDEALAVDGASECEDCA